MAEGDTREISALNVIEQTEDYLSELRYRIKKAKKLKGVGKKELLAKIEKVQNFIDEGDIDEVHLEMPKILRLEAELLVPVEKPVWRYYLDSALTALLLAIVIRGVALEAFRIPSGSMIPTLLIGDHIFANKLAYDLQFPFTDEVITRWADPQPGDVIVFKFPLLDAKEFQEQNREALGCLSASEFENERTVIKRVIALPGDRVELRKDQLFINGKPVKQTFVREDKSVGRNQPINEIVREELPNGRSYLIQTQGHPRGMPQRTVPPGMLFVLGDNRDNSSDSRCWGWVPIGNVIGRASLIWWSSDPDGGIRYDRIGRWVN